MVIEIIYRPRKDGKLSQLWWKEDRTNLQRSAELGFEPGTLWLEGRDLTTAQPPRRCAN